MLAFMSDPSGLLPAFSTLLYVLLDVLGIVLAIANMSKTRVPAMLLLVGSLIRLLVFGADRFVWLVMVQGADFSHEAAIFISTALSILSGLGLGMIIAAVFTGRARS